MIEDPKPGQGNDQSKPGQDQNKPGQGQPKPGQDDRTGNKDR